MSKDILYIYNNILHPVPNHNIRIGVGQLELGLLEYEKTTNIGYFEWSKKSSFNPDYQ